MFNTQEKKERALGVKLFLKANRCNSPKCALVHKPHRPGLQGKARHTVSEFGQQLNEKQKIKASYGLRETQMKRLFMAAAKNPGVTGNMMVQLLERRLDNAVFRLGLAASRSVARQLVGHGHILVNGRKITAPSYLVRLKEEISVRPQSKSHPAFKNLAETLKKYQPPVWLDLDKEQWKGTVISFPKDLEFPFDVNMVVDYYSK